MVAEVMDGGDAPREGKPNGTTTIFVGNLPFDIYDEQLEKEFSEIGPIKRAFIVKDKGNYEIYYMIYKEGWGSGLGTYLG